MTHEDYCLLIGDKDVWIFDRNRQIAALTQRIAILEEELRAAREAISPPSPNPKDSS